MSPSYEPSTKVLVGTILADRQRIDFSKLGGGAGGMPDMGGDDEDGLDEEGDDEMPGLEEEGEEGAEAEGKGKGKEVEAEAKTSSKIEELS